MAHLLPSVTIYFCQTICFHPIASVQAGQSTSSAQCHKTNHETCLSRAGPSPLIPIISETRCGMWWKMGQWRFLMETRCHLVLQVSALHYSAGDRVLGGFWTVASACALRQPNSCGSEYFYNQCPQVWNLIGTEHSLIEVSIGLRRKQAKSNSIDGYRNTEVFPIDLDFGL